jgi:hypothetical protein
MQIIKGYYKKIYFRESSSVFWWSEFLATDPGALPDYPRSTGGLLSLVNTIEDLLGRNNSDSDLENLYYVRRDPSCRPRGIFYPQELALTSRTSGGGSVGIVRSRAHATKFCF